MLLILVVLSSILVLISVVRRVVVVLVVKNGLSVFVLRMIMWFFSMWRMVCCGMKGSVIWCMVMVDCMWYCSLCCFSVLRSVRVLIMVASMFM